ncbi:MAG: NHL repeat-containing protein [Verrucomicrobiota bacterium]
MNSLFAISNESCRARLYSRIIWLTLVLGSLAVCTNTTRADTVYVWCEDGTILKFATNGVGTVITNNLSGWNGPVGLACDNVGNLYAGVPGASSIWRFSPEGNRSLVGYIDSVSGLAFDKSGNLFATIPNYGEVDKLDYILGFRYILNGLSTNRVSASSAVLTFDSQGIFYTANSGQNIVEKYSANFIGLGTFAANLNLPWGLAFDVAGNLFVSNSGTNGSLKNTIVKFTPGGVRSTFANAVSGLSSPRGLAFDSLGNLYAANSGDGTIRKFTTNGIGSIFASGLNSPTAIAIFPGLNLWSATPICLINSKITAGGTFQFDYIGNSGLTLTLLGTTNVSLPLTNWLVMGVGTENSPGQYQFSDFAITNQSQWFYRIRSP